MVRIVIRDEDQEKLHKHSEEIAALLNDNIRKLSPAHTIRLRGPMPAPIARIAGYYRNQIVMQSSRAESLQENCSHRCEAAYDDVASRKRGRGC